MLNTNKYEILTFDCYGTLIDWESGILGALRPVLSKYNVSLKDKQILELYAEIEAELEAREYIRYKEVLKRAVQQFGERFDFNPKATETRVIVDSLKDWKPFPDTVDSLHALKSKFKLAIISNIDDDLFVYSKEHLKVEFDWTITAEQAKSYKPSLNNFRFATETIGIPIENILHIAQSIYHDIIPAKDIGLSTVWVNRKKGREGTGATPVAHSDPDLEVPDLKTLVSILLNG